MRQQKPRNAFVHYLIGLIVIILFSRCPLSVTSWAVTDENTELIHQNMLVVDPTCCDKISEPRHLYLGYSVKQMCHIHSEPLQTFVDAVCKSCYRTIVHVLSLLLDYWLWTTTGKIWPALANPYIQI